MNDPDLAPTPDQQEGAYTNCECTDCREARLRDDERITYTARELAAAWGDGWLAGRQGVPDDLLVHAPYRPAILALRTLASVVADVIFDLEHGRQRDYATARAAIADVFALTEHAEEPQDGVTL